MTKAEREKASNAVRNASPHIRQRATWQWLSDALDHADEADAVIRRLVDSLALFDPTDLAFDNCKSVRAAKADAEKLLGGGP